MIKIGNGLIYNGDCLEVMKKLPDKSVDLILCDLPYGTTSCSWDVVIPFDDLWEEYKRLIKPNSAIVLFGQEPFSSLLRISNLKMFKYDWYWRKSRPSGFVNAKLKPLKDIEVISIFSTGVTANGSKNNMTYFPQGLEKVDKEWSRPSHYMEGDRGVNPARKSHELKRVIEYSGYPRQVLDFPNSNKNLLHPTQKPVALMEYLIKTYSEENSVVLDNCSGSGTVGIACENTNRNYILIEKDKNYFNVGYERILEHIERREY